MIEPGLGAACGAIAGVWFDVVATVVVRRMALVPGSRAASFVEGHGAMILVAPIVLFHSLWTLAGLFLGFAYWAMAKDSDGGISLAFVGIMGGIAALGAARVLQMARDHAAWLLSFALAFFLIFGLMLPFWASAAR
ncbi:MAG: hypothetical protein EXR48_05345 [Dehalococcoidia bacterium]|nr:hypothetical protein [Dehalococcoidia bacterium]